MTEDWIGRESLPGGFEAETPLAGGELLEWEKAALPRFDCSDRLSLNKFFNGACGREVLLSHLKRGAFCIDQPEESALMYLALHHTPATRLEPLFSRIRLYPRLLERGFCEPAFGLLHRDDAGQLQSTLEKYRLPLEVARKRESLQIWRPFFQRMLVLLEKTVEDRWPFQSYPQGWDAEALELSRAIDEALENDVLCAFPHREDSDFRRLHSAMRTAAEAPSRLNGRQVGFCKSLLEQDRADHVVPQELPGDGVLKAIDLVLQRLHDIPPCQGLEELELELPEAVATKVVRARLGNLSQLREWGLLNSLDVLSELAPRLVAGVFDDPLTSRTYKAFCTHARAVKFESLPWIEPFWQTPLVQKTFSVARMLLQSWWGYFPYRSAPAGLKIQLTTLARWSGLALEELTRRATPALDFPCLAGECRDYIARQKELSCPKPYLRVGRDRRVREAEAQLVIFESLGPNKESPPHLGN